MMEIKTKELRSERLRCVFSAYGASIAGVYVRMPDGSERLVTLSPTTLFTGEDEPSLAGRCIAPGCGRIKLGRRDVDGQVLMLLRNEGENHLHGGIHATQYRIWDMNVDGPNTISFECTLADGLDGYPGNRIVRVRYCLRGDTLRMEWEADTDAPTPFDLTNHVYWDLSGRFDGAALDQVLHAAAERCVYNDIQHVPTAIRTVRDTVFDFRNGASFRGMIEANRDDIQLRTGRGYNNALVSDGSEQVIRLVSGTGDLELELRTDRPAIVVYTGGFLDDQTILREGSAFPGQAVALEAQDIPDRSRISGESAEILRPGRSMHHFIEWRIVFPTAGGQIPYKEAGLFLVK